MKLMLVLTMYKLWYDSFSKLGVTSVNDKSRRDFVYVVTLLGVDRMVYLKEVSAKSKSLS